MPHGNYVDGEAGHLAVHNILDAVVDQKTTPAMVAAQITTALTGLTPGSITDAQLAAATATGATKASLDTRYVGTGTFDASVVALVAWRFGLTPLVNTAPAFTASTPPGATVGVAYSYTFAASGAPAPTFAVTTGTLPAGLTLTTGGLLSGTPTTAQTSTFTVTASNGVAPAATDASTVAVAATGVAPVWQYSQAPAGEVGELYSFTFIASGTPTPSYEVTVGSVPPGLTFTPEGLLSGTPTTAGSSTFTVTADNGVAPFITRQRTIVIAAAASSATGLVYGPGIGTDTKSNYPIQANQKVAFKFKAAVTSALNAVRFTQRSGPGGEYSAGNFGTMTITVRPDDGSGHPHASTILATKSFTPTGSNSTDTEVFDLKTFASPPTLTAGTTYYIVFTGSSDSNFLSVNVIYCYNSTVPRQPKFPDADFGMLLTSGSWGALHSGATPVVDLVYADGTVQGQGYYEAMILHWRTITGTSKMAREQFTVSGGAKTVAGAYARVRRGGTNPASSGTSPLILSLDSIDPSTRATLSTIATVSVPASSIPVSAPGGDNGGSVWAGGPFAGVHVLADGGSYALRLSTASGTTYTTHPIREGLDETAGSGPYNSPGFSDGSGQFATTATNWVDMYEYGRQDMQCYFPLA